MSEELVSQRDENDRWKALISESEAAIERFLIPNVNMDLGPFIRCVTFRVFLVVFLGVDPATLAFPNLLLVTGALTDFYDDAEGKSTLPSEVQSFLYAWLPHEKFPASLDRILPAYEALWRIVATLVVTCKDDETNALCWVMLDFRDNPRDRQYRASFRDDGRSVSTITDGVVHRIMPIARPPCATTSTWPLSCIQYASANDTRVGFAPTVQEALKCAALLASKIIGWTVVHYRISSNGITGSQASPWVGRRIHHIPRSTAGILIPRSTIADVHLARLSGAEAEMKMLPYELNLRYKRTVIAFAPVCPETHVRLGSKLWPHRSMNPSVAADVALTDVLLAIQMEKLRVEEALAARDNVVAHLEDAYISIRQKAETISRLEQELEVFKRASTPANTNSGGSESVLKASGTPLSGTSQIFDEDERMPVNSAQECQDTLRGVSSELPCTPEKLGDSLQSNSAYCRQVYINTSALTWEPHTQTALRPPCDEESQVSSTIAERIPAEQTIAARQAILASLPLPLSIPDDALQPIMIRPPYTLHELLGNISGSLKDILKNYRVLSQSTTYWCPDREEHGYFLTPVFKCSTNPRVATAHRWSSVDVIDHMNKPTECFYNKDGKSYYAGTYKAFQMDDLTIEEWESLSTETTQAIVKETLAGRKNVSPQNHYETFQLYAAGALRVACVGLRCVGFSDDTYRGVLEQSRFVYWGQSSAWTPARTTIALNETTDDAKSALS